MKKFFVSYRRSDSEEVAGRISDWLIREFGRSAVFFDVDSIPPGVDFREYMQQALDECAVFLAILGPCWLSADDGSGGRRLDREDDHVRIELDSALNTDVSLVPLLVRGAEMPTERELPGALGSFSFKHAMRIRSGGTFRTDIDALIAALRRQLSAKAVVDIHDSDEGDVGTSLERGFVSGRWDVSLHVEPGVESSVSMSPGAAFVILGEEEYKNDTWTHVRCEDEREGWIKERVAVEETDNVRIAPCSRRDRRTFFSTLHEQPSRAGFILRRVHVTKNGRGNGGSMDVLPFSDHKWGDVNIDLPRIREIRIDRRGDTPRVMIQTERSTYDGELAPADSTRRALLIVSRPFVGLSDVSNEIDLRTVEYAHLQKLDAQVNAEK